MIADSAGGAWTFGGSILTFAFPMILFIVVACALYMAYTRPEVVPGHRRPAAEHPVTYTTVPGQPATAGVPPAAASAPPAAASGETAKPEGGE